MNCSLFLRLAAFWTICGRCFGLIVALPAATPAESLQGIALDRLKDGQSVDLGEALSSTKAGSKTMLVLGTHPADFNTIEYAQRVRAFLPELKAKGIERILMVINGSPSSCNKLTQLLDLPEADVEVCSDPAGKSGRRFGVSRG